MRTFLINGLNLQSDIQADSAFNEVGLLLDRIVEEHRDRYKSIRMLELVIELRDTLRQRYNRNITVSISIQPPHKHKYKAEIALGYIFN